MDNKSGNMPEVFKNNEQVILSNFNNYQIEKILKTLQENKRVYNNFMVPREVQVFVKKYEILNEIEIIVKKVYCGDHPCFLVFFHNISL